jgi:hypothetical protein
MSHWDKPPQAVTPAALTCQNNGHANERPLISRMILTVSQWNKPSHIVMSAALAHSNNRTANEMPLSYKAGSTVSR